MSREELIESMVTSVMEDFDFDRVHNVMVSLNWRWFIEGVDNSVPSIYRLMKVAERLLRDCVQYYGEQEFHSICTGGLRASLERFTLSLQFILAETSVDHSDFIHVKEG